MVKFQIMITVDQLFAEDFMPVWMQQQQRSANIQRFIRLYSIAAIWLMNDMLDIVSWREWNARVDYAYRSAATNQRLRLTSRCDMRGNYTNGSFFASAK